MGANPPTAHRWSRPRWWELVPETVLLIGLGVFLVDETDAATSAFESARALTVMATVAGAWIAARLLLARFVPWPTVRVVPLVIAAGAILAIVVLPAYRPHVVVEQLRADGVPVAEPNTGPSTGPVPGENGPSTVVTPQLIRSSSFRGVDHRARGAVNIYRRGDGRYVIGLEEFEIQPGPDYDVYLVPGADRTDRTRGTRVDDLRGNAGTQFYDAPPGIDLDGGPWTVLIWCETFGVPVATSTPV
jgi:hypothetical protein